MDVDDFRAVNDTYGHPGGDSVLIALGDVLRRVSRAQDVPARLGGDDFALLLPGCKTAGATRVAARMAESFPQVTSRVAMPSTLSIGISSTERTPGHSLLAAAHAALYRGKPAAGTAPRSGCRRPDAGTSGEESESSPGGSTEPRPSLMVGCAAVAAPATGGREVDARPHGHDAASQ